MHQVYCTGSVEDKAVREIFTWARQAVNHFQQVKIGWYVCDFSSDEDSKETR